MGPLDPRRNFMQFATTNVSIACICVRFEPKIRFWNLRFVVNTVFCKIHTFLYVLNKVVLSNWPYGSWDHITNSENKLIWLEERYQKTSQRWILHFSSYLIINWFLCKWWIKLIVPSCPPPIHFRIPWECVNRFHWKPISKDKDCVLESNRYLNLNPFTNSQGILKWITSPLSPNLFHNSPGMLKSNPQ